MLETDVYFFHWVMVGGEGKMCVCVWMGWGWGGDLSQVSFRNGASTLQSLFKEPKVGALTTDHCWQQIASLSYKLQAMLFLFWYHSDMCFVFYISALN